MTEYVSSRTKGPFVASSRGRPIPSKTRPKRFGPTLICNGRRVGITSEEGPMPVISPRGERKTSSFVKPTTSAMRFSLSFDQTNLAHLHVGNNCTNQHPHNFSDPSVDCCKFYIFQMSDSFSKSGPFDIMTTLLSITYPISIVSQIINKPKSYL